MGKDSSIQWCHSSLNLQMGCDGCELWNNLKKICYAGTQTDGKPGRRGLAGAPGWPSSFGEPKLFLDRLAPALKWGPPTPKERDAKPWMAADMPRLIFLNDMGDTFSNKLPLDWMAPILAQMGESKHQFLLLTKRPSRMAEFSESHPFPNNFWLGTSITSAKSSGRIDSLLKVKGGLLKFISFEPMWSAMPEKCFDGIQWAIFGAESGTDPTLCEMRWIEQALFICGMRGISAFVKQLGPTPIWNRQCDGDGADYDITDSHGGNWDEWPENLRVREFPVLATNRTDPML